MSADKSLDQYVREAQDRDPTGSLVRMDQYMSGQLKLAIHELEKHAISAFSFRSVDDMLKVSMSGDILTSNNLV